jgi:hypothetical protein
MLRKAAGYKSNKNCCKKYLWSPFCLFIQFAVQRKALIFLMDFLQNKFKEKKSLEFIIEIKRVHVHLYMFYLFRKMSNDLYINKKQKFSPKR